MMKNEKISVKTLVLLGLMTAVLLIMAYTPLGYLKVGALSITFNMIPVAISAIALGPVGGAVIGGVFGLTSFLQAVQGTSSLGSMLFSINPVYSAVLCFVPRILDGLLVGFISDLIKKRGGSTGNMVLASAVSGFAAAFLNTLFFMTTLMILFGNSDVVVGYREKLAPGKNVLIFVCVFVGINAVVEMISSTFFTAMIGTALYKAKLISADAPSKKTAEAV